MTILDRPGSTFRKVVAIPEVGILIPLVAFILLFYWLNPSLLNRGNITAVMRNMSFVGIIVVGQCLLMVAGELDLSVGAVAGLSAIVSAWLMKEGGCPPAVGIVGGLAVGAVVGLVNGLVSVWIGVPAFIATLGMMYIAHGVNYVICKGYSVYPLPESVNAFGNAEPLGISWSFFLFIAVVIVGDLGLRFSVFGRMAYATGGNREVARIAGINTSAVKIACFVLTGALASAAGILSIARLNVGDPTIGREWELKVIASVVIGGVSLFGGIGTIAGGVLGLLLMLVVESGLGMIGLNTNWQTVAVGLIMILAVAFDLLRRRTKT